MGSDKRNSGERELHRVSKKNSAVKLVKSPKASKSKPRSFQSTVELDELRNTVDEWFASTGETQAYKKIAIGSSVAVIGILAMVLGMFSMLIPLTYGVGGLLLYRNKGWRFYQPGVGGARFVALNGVAWSMYAISVVLQIANFALRDPLVTFNVYLVGSLSYVLLLGALFSYYPPKGSKRSKTSASVSVPSEKALEDERRYQTPTFNDELQHSVLMRTSDNSPSAFWWVFIGMQMALVITAFMVCVVGSFSKGPIAIRMLTTTLAMWVFGAATASTHALGGKWRHISTNYAAFQPGKGGAKYIAVQAVAWIVFAFSVLAGFATLASQARVLGGKKPIAPGLMAATGALGLVAQLLIIGSLFLFEEDEDASQDVDVKGFKKMVEEEENSPFSRALNSFVQMQFNFINLIWGPSDPDAATRDPIQTDPDAHLGCEEKWARVTAHCKASGDCYLVIGNGFVGKRLVNRLLERGETNVRVFDIVENNHWKGDDRVTFIRGDVTKPESIGPACEGVNTVYSTFAIIQFFARLEHQAFISYHINVTGTEVLIDAMKENNVKRCIVTSSSHATTDEHSEPRFDRDETAKLLSRKEAHNHYGWTKAIADEISLKADGAICANGEELEVCVVRPCSGVFGADDKLSFEKVMDMRCAPGLGATSIMDWVYVENVVLGHILAEQALQDNVEGVRGEAFCVSNDDGVSMQDFWMLTRKHIQLMPSKKMRDRLMIMFLWIPEWPLWALAYVSELNQYLFKGKVSLGRDLDILTPGTLSTATMSYTYKSDKARKVLGYEPVFTLDEAIQRSLNEYYVNHYKDAKKTN